MQKKTKFTIFFDWIPKKVERGGSLNIELQIRENLIESYSLFPSDGSYFSHFELSLMEVLLSFVKDKSLSLLESQKFREIESYLRTDNTISVSKNDEEGEQIIDEFKFFLIEELFFHSVEQSDLSFEDLKVYPLVEKILKIQNFFSHHYNQLPLVSLFEQRASLVNFTGDVVVISLPKIYPVMSESLLLRILEKKFSIKQIKLVAKHPLTR